MPTAERNAGVEPDVSVLPRCSGRRAFPGNCPTPVTPAARVKSSSLKPHPHRNSQGFAQNSGRQCGATTSTRGHMPVLATTDRDTAGQRLEWPNNSGHNLTELVRDSGLKRLIFKIGDHLHFQKCIFPEILHFILPLQLLCLWIST